MALPLETVVVRGADRKAGGSVSGKKGTDPKGKRQAASRDRRLVEPVLRKARLLRKPKLSRKEKIIRRQLRKASAAEMTPLNLGSLQEVMARAEEEVDCGLGELLSKSHAPGGRWGLGEFLAEKEWLVEAELAFRRAVGDHPDRAAPLVALGEFLKTQGRDREAATAFFKADELTRKKRRKDV
ncbi:MAG: hypothetical protein HQL56_07745 [Magnetococcales bacterium]|nr:hypothetical protein [Magnetococcales bacterium]